MRQNFVVLVGFAGLLLLLGGVGVGVGVVQNTERIRTEAARRERCVESKKAGKTNCCLLCGRHGVYEQLVAMGGKNDSRTMIVFLCEEHHKLGAQQAYDRVKVQRNEDPRLVIALGGLGLLLGGILLLVLLLARRKWDRQLAEARAYEEERR